MKTEWTLLFCDGCHEPTVPSQLEKYADQYLCESCEIDLANGTLDDDDKQPPFA